MECQVKERAHLLLVFFLGRRLSLRVPDSLIPVPTESANLEPLARDEDGSLSDEEDVRADLASGRIDAGLDGARETVRAEHDVRRQRNCSTALNPHRYVSILSPLPTPAEELEEKVNIPFSSPLSSFPTISPSSSSAPAPSSLARPKKSPTHIQKLKLCFAWSVRCFSMNDTSSPAGGPRAKLSEGQVTHGGGSGLLSILLGREKR
jgi:hypothetical protein